MSNEPPKKPAADTRHPDAPPGYDTRMNWIKLTAKDMTVGSKGLNDRIEARKDPALSGYDILWSRTDRHYWIGQYDSGTLVNWYRIIETVVSPSQERRE